MNEKFAEFECILNEEDQLLDSMLNRQKELRQAVTDKEWVHLTKLLSEMNTISDSFQVMDFRRNEIQTSLLTVELKPYFDKIRGLRGKLLRCKLQNQVLDKYVTVSRDLVRNVIEKALPQERNRNYSRSGLMAAPKPKSVVVNQLY